MRRDPRTWTRVRERRGSRPSASGRPSSTAPDIGRRSGRFEHEPGGGVAVPLPAHALAHGERDRAAPGRLRERGGDPRERARAADLVGALEGLAALAGPELDLDLV